MNFEHQFPPNPPLGFPSLPSCPWYHPSDITALTCLSSSTSRSLQSASNMVLSSILIVLAYQLPQKEFLVHDLDVVFGALKRMILTTNSGGESRFLFPVGSTCKGMLKQTGWRRLAQISRYIIWLVAKGGKLNWYYNQPVHLKWTQVNHVLVILYFLNWNRFTYMPHSLATSALNFGNKFNKTTNNRLTMHNNTL